MELVALRVAGGSERTLSCRTSYWGPAGASGTSLNVTDREGNVGTDFVTLEWIFIF